MNPVISDDDFLDQLDQQQKSKVSLAEQDDFALLDALDKNPKLGAKLRAMTTTERAESQLLQAPPDVWDKVLLDQGIDPKSRSKWEIQSAPANLGRVAAMEAGTLGGTTLLPIPILGGAVGAGAAKVAIDQAMGQQAKHLADTGASPISKGVLEQYPLDKQAFTSAAEGGLYGLSSGVAPLVLKAMGAAGRGITAKAAQGLEYIADTPLGQRILANPAIATVGKITSKAVDAVGGAGDAVSKFLFQNISRGSRKLLNRFETQGWNKTMHQYDDDVINFTANRLGRNPADFTKKEIADILDNPDAYQYYLKNSVENELVPAIQQTRASLGRAATEAKKSGGLWDPNVKFDFTPENNAQIIPTVSEIIQNHPKLLPQERSAIKASLNRLAGRTVDAEGKVTYNPITYSKVNDELNMLADKLYKNYEGVSSRSMAGRSTLDSALSQYRQAINDVVRNTNPEYGTLADQYTDLMKRIEYFDHYVGADPKTIHTNVIENLMADPTHETMYAQDAFDKVTGDLPPAVLEKLKDLSAAIWGRGGEIQTAGVKTYPAQMAGKIAGGAIAGAAIGAGAGGARERDWSGVGRGAAVGMGLGGLAVASHITPQITVATRKAMESSSRALRRFTARRVEKMEPEVSSVAKLYALSAKGRPILDAVNYIQSTLGAGVTDRDIRNLKK